ncbi:hypothetical protein FS837_007731, partial [Tulasnella sp. UAMH 9824]
IEKENCEARSDFPHDILEDAQHATVATTSTLRDYDTAAAPTALDGSVVADVALLDHNRPVGISTLLDDEELYKGLPSHPRRPAKAEDPNLVPTAVANLLDHSADDCPCPRRTLQNGPATSGF